MTTTEPAWDKHDIDTMTTQPVRWHEPIVYPSVLDKLANASKETYLQLAKEVR